MNRAGVVKKRTMNFVIYCSLFFISLIGSSLMYLSVVKADGEEKSNNKFNVVVVMDSSNSMNETDPEGYRFEAVGLFINLLTQNGNKIGSVVFSNDILAKQDIVSADGQEVKDKFIEDLRQVNATGYTNIGKGLNDAVDMIVANGDSNLNSVVLFLSDGNTEMPDEEQLELSLSQKADAIQKARDNDIQIFSVCLNVNNEADVSEMKQIADATDGVFEEVQNAEDLRDVFNEFYDIVYGASTIKIGDLTFDESGEVTKNFTVPAFGVEEVNIIVYGKLDDVSILNPNGDPVNASTIISNTYTIVKFQDVSAGEWTFIAHGSPGTQIKVNMVYNSDISLKTSTNYDKNNPLTKDDYLEISAQMVSNGVIADQDEQYSGFEANLIVMNAYREEISRSKMSVESGKFISKEKYASGSYYFTVELSGNQILKQSEELGPFKIIEMPEPEPLPENTPPYPVKGAQIEETVYIIPFIDNTKTISIAGLAADKEDSELKYDMDSSSFVDGTDYTFDGKNIVITNFSLRKGAFTIRAYDSEGLYCDIEIIVKSINVGVITLIIAGVIGLIVLVIIGMIIYKLAGVPFRGDITVRSIMNGTETGSDTKRGRTGHILLSRFRVESVGFEKKARFQATGKARIEFISKQVFYVNGMPCKKKAEINGNGSENRISLQPNSADYIMVTFTPRQYNNPSGNGNGLFGAKRKYGAKGKSGGNGNHGYGNQGSSMNSGNHGYGNAGSTGQGNGYGYGSSQGPNQGNGYGYGSSNKK